MKSLVATLLLLICAQAAFAADLDNGIYAASQKVSAPSVRNQAGQARHLGQKHNLKIKQSFFFAQDNANTEFVLSMNIPYDKDLGPSTYLLVVEGTAYDQNGSGSSQQETSSLNFMILGEQKAKQVAKYLGIPIVYRKHPQHKLGVRFMPTKREFQPGEEVTATLQITNVGANTVAFMKGGRNRAARDNQYLFAAYFNGKGVEDIGTTNHFGGLASRRALKPGETFEDRISLSKWFAFDKSGLYDIHGSYYLDFQDPGGHSWRTLWEDYVSADFSINIK